MSYFSNLIHVPNTLTKFIYCMCINSVIFLAGLHLSNTTLANAAVSAKELIDTDTLQSLTYTYDTPIGSDIYIQIRGQHEGQEVIRAFNTPLNPNPFKKHGYHNDIVDARTLRPLVKHFIWGTLQYDYSQQGKILMTHSEANGARTYTFDAKAHNYVVTGPAVNLLAESLPLRVGLEIEFPGIWTAFMYSPKAPIAIHDYVLSVTDTTSLKVQGIEQEAYIVKIHPKDSEIYGSHIILYVTKEAPHMTLKSIQSDTESIKSLELDNIEMFDNFGTINYL